MNKIIRYSGLPVLLNILFFANAFIPVDVLGCSLRGWVAFTIAMVSGIAAIVTGIISIKKRIVGDNSATMWIILTLILCVPVAALVFLA
jgi:hypothetical protein